MDSRPDRKRSSGTPPRGAAGFTLVEIVLVIAVLAIMAVVAAFVLTAILLPLLEMQSAIGG